MDKPRILALGTHNDTLQLLDTYTGEIHNPHALPQLVAEGPGGYLGGVNLFTVVAQCQKAWGESASWVIRIQAKTRKVIRGNKRAVYGTFLPIYFGFRQRQQVGGRANREWLDHSRYFHCIDFDEISGQRSIGLTECVETCYELLAMCQRRGVKWNANRGGLAARLLKASPKWEADRRAAPRFINEHAREFLPGNYYSLGARISKSYKTAIYVDQSSAHHSIAASIETPHPNHTHARGRTRELEKGKPKQWLNRYQYDSVLRQYGLVAGMVSIKTIPNNIKHLYPPFMHTPGRRIVHFYTNEYYYFTTEYADLEYIVAAWVSPIPDPAVKEYAEWSLDELHNEPHSKYKKPLLLAAYGTLAKKSEPDKPFINYYAGAGKGWKTELPIAGVMREVIWRPKETQIQPAVVNVIARGMIEAETRVRALKYALELHRMGMNILSIYVDGLIIETDALSLFPPMMPDGWRVSHVLTHVRFFHPNSFVSDQIDKLPGVPTGELRDRINKRYRAREPFNNNREEIARKMRARLLVAPTAEGALARDELLPF
jgi:hypothetical protein